MKEPIDQLLDQLLSGKGGAITQSTQQCDSSAINQVAALMKQAKANYPAMEIAQETATVWIDQWAEMVRDYDLELFARALKRCFRVMKFFPLPADIESELKAIWLDETNKRNAESVWARCGQCDCFGMSEDAWLRSANGVYRPRCYPKDTKAHKLGA